MPDDVVALQRRIKELQAQVDHLTYERDIARIDRQCAMTELAHAYDLQHAQVDVPAELAHALRSVSPHRLQAVHLTIGGHDLRVLVDGAAYQADPGAEARVWNWLTEHTSEAPTHSLTRLEMPDRLYGVAWPHGQIAVSLSLSGTDVVAAHRALRPRRQCGLLRALGLLAIPAPAAGRAVLSVLRDAQATTSAAASAATTATTTAVGAALPAVTAAAISYTAVTSCAPEASADTRPPSAAQVMDSMAPLAFEPPAPAPRTPGRRMTPLKPSQDSPREQTSRAPARPLTPPAEPAAQPRPAPVPAETSPSKPPIEEVPPVIAEPLPATSPDGDATTPPTPTTPSLPVEPEAPAPTEPALEEPTLAEPAPVESTPSADAPSRDGEPAENGSPLETAGTPTTSPERPLALLSP
ncbi:hypothetical protein [Actinomadura sp. WMMA1423]|uniref:hypothetical protein n=1 Tax=Actinomadura sp. WMMA1423 TaxID=2591108 RepID=UPI00114681B1|nr:hypothetical protein [Actinomadura sp. WMMA1423]